MATENKQKYDASFKNAVKGLLSLPGEIDRQTGISEAVKSGASTVAQNLSTGLGIMGDAVGMVTKSATGQIGAQAMSDKYVNPPGGLNTGGALALVQPTGPTLATGVINPSIDQKVIAANPAMGVLGGPAPGSPEALKQETEFREAVKAGQSGPVRTPIDTGGMGRANTIPEAMSKINAGINQGAKYDTNRDTVIEQPGASETNLRSWKDAEGRTHIEGGRIGPPGPGDFGVGQQGSPNAGGAADINRQINTMIDDLVGAQQAKYGKGHYSRAGINAITTLRGQQLGFMGQQLQAETNLVGHGLTAQANKDAKIEASKDRLLSREMTAAGIDSGHKIERDKLNQHIKEWSATNDPKDPKSVAKLVFDIAKQTSTKKTTFGMDEFGQKTGQEVEGEVDLFKAAKLVKSMGFDVPKEMLKEQPKASVATKFPKGEERVVNGRKYVYDGKDWNLKK